MWPPLSIHRFIKFSRSKIKAGHNLLQHTSKWTVRAAKWGLTGTFPLCAVVTYNCTFNDCAKQSCRGPSWIALFVSLPSTSAFLLEKINLTNVAFNEQSCQICVVTCPVENTGLHLSFILGVRSKSWRRRHGEGSTKNENKIVAERDFLLFSYLLLFVLFSIWD